MCVLKENPDSHPDTFLTLPYYSGGHLQWATIELASALFVAIYAMAAWMVLYGMVYSKPCAEHSWKSFSHEWNTCVANYAYLLCLPEILISKYVLINSHETSYRTQDLNPWPPRPVHCRQVVWLTEPPRQAIVYCKQALHNLFIALFFCFYYNGQCASRIEHCQCDVEWCAFLCYSTFPAFIGSISGSYVCTVHTVLWQNVCLSVR